MKNRAAIGLCLLLASLTVSAEKKLSIAGMSVTLRLPKDMTARDDSSRASRTSDTRCLAFGSKALRRDVGLMCLTSSASLLGDYGLKAIQASTHGSPEVVTGMSAYRMTDLKLPRVKVYSADVDCDEGNQAVYRATSTCNVIAAPLGHGKYLFSNFVLRNHTKNAEVVNRADVDYVWRHAVSSTRPREP